MKTQSVVPAHITLPTFAFGSSYLPLVLVRTIAYKKNWHFVSGNAHRLLNGFKKLCLMSLVNGMLAISLACKAYIRFMAYKLPSTKY